MDPFPRTSRAPSLDLDPSLARELVRRLDLDLGRDASVAGLGLLVTAMARALPVGTVAKHEATARGELPPGADADACARLVLAGLDGARPRPDSPSWTCWVLTTLCRGLVERGWGWPAHIVATRNLDGRVAVDFHSMVEVATPDGVVVLDPLFAIGPVPVDGAGARGPWHGAVAVDGDGRRTYRWSTTSDVEARYRSVSGPLDAGDITAFLHVSTTFTGMSARRWWRLIGPTTSASLTDDEVQAPLLKRATSTASGWVCGESTFPSWVDATEAAIDHVWSDPGA